MSRPTNHYFATFALAVLVAFLFSASANAQAIKLLGQLDPFDGDNRYSDVWGEGNYAYLGSFGGTGLMIIDISNPTAPRLAGNYNPAEGGRFQDVMVINGIGYFSSESRGGVHIVDVRNPASPVLLSQITQDKNGFPNVHELFVADGVLYEADSRTTVVKVFDVRDPRNPVFVRNIQTTDTRFIHAIVCVNGRLFTSGWSGKTDIYDVRDVLTAAPPLLGSFDSGTNSHASWPSNDGTLLASARETTNGDVRLFDISNPASPVQLSAITAQSLGLEAFSAHNPYIIGNLLYVSWYQAGLVILDITDPRQPKLIGAYDTFPGTTTSGFDGCWGVYPFLGFDRVLLSDLDGGLFIVDATAAQTGPRTVSEASYSF
ncbi:MAG: choice-of-anchor B family protein [Acidobacteriota bacterium]